MLSLHHQSVPGEENPLCLKSGFLLSKLSFLLVISPPFSHSLIIMLLLYLVFLSELFGLSRWGIGLFR